MPKFPVSTIFRTLKSSSRGLEPAAFGPECVKTQNEPRLKFQQLYIASYRCLVKSTVSNYFFTTFAGLVFYCSERPGERGKPLIGKPDYRLLSLYCLNQRLSTHDIYNSLQIISKHMQTHFCIHPLKCFHLEMRSTHPHFYRTKRMFYR